MTVARQDLYDTVRSALLARADLKAKPKRDGTIHFRCLRHNDTHPSAWLKGGSYGCMRCGFREPLKSLAHDLGVTVAGRDFTVEDYAALKQFDAAWLRKEWQLHEADPNGHGNVVALPYLAPDGSVLRTKYRSSNGMMWWDRDGHGIYPYGLHKLNGRRAVILCEGESDTHACWTHNVQALGIPGANTWRREFTEYVRGKDVYIWQEPDAGGDAFVRTVAADLPQARVIHPQGVKDLADLHRKHGAAFRDVLRQWSAEAVPAGVPRLAVPFDAMLGERLRTMMEEKLKPVDSVPTPLGTWNRWCCDAGGRRGLARGWHVVLAGTPGLGKSTMALNMAYHAALAGERVTYITLEMSQDQLATRLASIMSGVPIRLLEQGDEFHTSSYEEAMRRVHEIEELHGGVVCVNRRPLHRLQDVVDSITFNHEVYGSRFYIIDYLQLAWSGRANSIYDQIVEVSHAVNSKAKDLAVTTIGLSQFNRDSSKAEGKPSIHGLMGGSSLENDADQVALLWANEENTDDYGRRMTMVLGKNRHGPAGDIPIYFDKTTLRISELLPDEMASWTVKG